LGGGGAVVINFAGEVKVLGGNEKEEERRRWPARQFNGDGETLRRPEAACNAATEIAACPRAR
jgi:hypothetical protein